MKKEKTIKNGKTISKLLTNDKTARVEKVKPKTIVVNTGKSPRVFTRKVK